MYRSVYPLLLTGLAILLTASGCHGTKRIANNSERDPRFVEHVSVSSNTSATSGVNTGTKKTLRDFKLDDASHLRIKYSSMLGIKPHTITNLELYRFIDEWYKVSHKLGGNDKNGIDCSAFAQRLYDHVFKMNLYRSAAEQFRNCEMIKDRDKLKEGDLVFFRTRGNRISHVGIYLANQRFVHVSTSQGVIISSLKEDYWNKTYAGAGKIKKQS